MKNNKLTLDLFKIFALSGIAIISNSCGSDPEANSNDPNTENSDNTTEISLGDLKFEGDDKDQSVKALVKKIEDTVGKGILTETEILDVVDNSKDKNGDKILKAVKDKAEEKIDSNSDLDDKQKREQKDKIKQVKGGEKVTVKNTTETKTTPDCKPKEQAVNGDQVKPESTPAVKNEIETSDSGEYKEREGVMEQKDKADDEKKTAVAGEVIKKTANVSTKE